ncbi:hypothetical protein CXB51_032029 [Gossypium anomalum]|uniref:DUF4283 domain-containing protein n=1 Tax=Gossypium anomalum TaxID=47600 RepID=A0A8J6CPD7_9ROSI|nr:hypothetical protein CXB51_032029 [Gossypium anomalum]
MEEKLANLSLLDEEEEAFHEEGVVMEKSFQFFLVGRCLTDSVVHFPSLVNTMVDLWHSIGGICITDLGEKRLSMGGDPATLALNSTEFWIQVHELPPGLLTETMAKQVGDFCGKFIEYDTSIPSLGHKKYMRIRIRLDVSAPLKRKKKIQIGKDMIVYAEFNTKAAGHSGEQHTDGLEYGPMDLVLEEENDPIAALEEKKRQRIVEGPLVIMGSNIGNGSFILSLALLIRADGCNENP